MTTLEILTQARGLISDPEKWCQTYSARDASGFAVAPERPQAIKWCAIGSVLKIGSIVGDRYQTDLARWYLRRTAVDMHYTCATLLNDNSNHPTVMAMFDKAIELAQQEAIHAS